LGWNRVWSGFLDWAFLEEAKGEESLNEYLQIILTAILTGIGMGTGIAIGTYFANKALIQNVEKLVTAIKNNTEEKKENGEVRKDSKK
jgi:hypothetical protein